MPTDAELANLAEQRAAGVLAANRTVGSAGAWTVPSRDLYPHQWSWDSAFHALGWAGVDPPAAIAELSALFGAQWSDGRIPHIAFNPAVADAAYFPGPTFWAATGRAADGRATSGNVQPPVHAGIVAKMGAGIDGGGWLAGAYAALTAWHGYLFERRIAPGRRLVSIVHPWESGMDNSPMFDGPLAAVPVDGVPPYRRRDLVTGDPSTRPTDDDYDRYVVLAAQYRDRGYADDLGPIGGAGASPGFVVECPLFNAALAWSEDALADIAVRTGHDPSPHLARAAALTDALVADLWSDELGAFAGYDVLAGRQVAAPCVAGLAPLLARRLAQPVVERVVATACAAYGLDGDGVQLPTTPPGGAGHDAARYWRGPAWANVNWLVVQGLRIHDFDGHAERLAARTLDLVRRAGMREYFHAVDGRGLGATDFGWTAAVTLDLLGDLRGDLLSPIARPL